MHILESTDHEVLVSAQHSASSGSSNNVNARSVEYAKMVIYITAKSGAPTLTITLQCSPVDPSIDNTKWRTVYSEPTLTNTQIGTTFPKIVAGVRQSDFTGWLRVAYVVAGASTPKLTFALNIETK